MDLDVGQTRRLFLAGTAAIPQPFPSTGAISIEDGSLRYSRCGEPDRKTFVVVQTDCGLCQTTLSVVLATEVAALFFPGFSEGDCDQPADKSARCCDCVKDFKDGVWFLTPEIDARTISERLKVDISRRDANVRGIAFVPKSHRVLTMSEVSAPAGAVKPRMHRRCSCCN